MDTKILEIIRNNAKAYSLRRGGRPGEIVDPDDFAQFCALYALEHTIDGVKFNYKARYCDFMREIFGYRLPNGERKGAAGKAKFAARGAICIAADILPDTQRPSADVLADLKNMPRFFQFMKPHLQLQYILHHKFGFNLQEIAIMRGKHLSRISQEMKEAQEMVDRNIRRATLKKIVTPENI